MAGRLILTTPQAVALLGVSRRTFERGVQEGVYAPLTPQAGRKPATWDAAALVAAYVAHRERRAGWLDVQQERAALARSQREKCDLEVAAKRRDLVPRVEFEAAWADYILKVRARLLAVPAQARVRGLDAAAVATVAQLVRAALDVEAGDEEAA